MRVRISTCATPRGLAPPTLVMMEQERVAPGRSLVAYGEEEEEEEEAARSSDDDLLVPVKRVRVQKTEDGERYS